MSSGDENRDFYQIIQYSGIPHIRNSLFNFRADALDKKGDISFKLDKNLLLERPCYTIDWLSSTVFPICVD